MELYNDTRGILAKALLGHAMSPRELETRLMLEPGSLRRLRGHPRIKSIADALELDSTALANAESPREEVEPPAGLTQLVLPFEEDEVNVWVIDHEGHRLVIDAGFGAHDLEQQLLDSPPFDLLITHSHRDHIGGLQAILPRARKCYAPSDITDANSVAPGDSFKLGPWQVDAHDLSGHHPAAVGYQLRCGELELAAVGDAIFARSIGRCLTPEDYQQVRETLVRMCELLSPKTLLLTGHGPLARLDIERRENPFLAKWTA